MMSSASVHDDKSINNAVWIAGQNSATRTDFNALAGETTTPLIHGHSGDHSKRSYRRAENIRRFVGVDGEGITYNDPSGKTFKRTERVKEKGRWILVEKEYPRKKHDYVLLSVGEKSLHKDGEKLSLDEILGFLWKCFLEDPEAIYVGFYLSYDWTQWFKGLPYPVARSLLTDEGVKKRKSVNTKNPRPIPVRFGEWIIDILGMKRFRFRHIDTKKWMYLCDMGPFFQTSFINTLIQWRKTDPGICTEYEFQLVSEGKKRRDIAVFDKEMITYNQLENVLLSRVAVKLNEGFSALGIHLKNDQWFGPGQCAQEFLKQIGAPLSTQVKEWVPFEVLEWGQWSYYGGWSEIFCHGHIPGTVFVYDRNSAYPFEIAKLPCLSCGKWERTSKPSGICLVDCTVKQAHRRSTIRTGAMPYRTRNGTILRPRNVRGIYWWAEIESAKRAGAIDSVKVHGKAWVFLSRCAHKPFAAIGKLYDRRKAIGKDTPLGIAIKLLINSIYGKLAQSIGDPKYANSIYASLITSGCRIGIWETIATHPEKTRAVTMVATDAVIFRTKHPGLKISSELGDWSETTRENITQHMPGIYWDDNTRKSADGKIKTRGFNASDLRGSIEYLDESWTEFRHDLWERQLVGFNEWAYREAELLQMDMLGETDEHYSWYITQGWPNVTVPVTFGMVSAKLALHRNAWWQAGELLETQRTQNSYAGFKRDVSGLHLDSDVCWTMPYNEGPDGIRSIPYSKEFGMDLRNKLQEQEILTGSDTVDNEFYAFLQSKPEDMMEWVNTE